MNLKYFSVGCQFVTMILISIMLALIFRMAMNTSDLVQLFRESNQALTYENVYGSRGGMEP